MRQFEPVRAAAEGAARFTHGGHSTAGLENTQADSVKGWRVAQAYKHALAEPTEAPGIRSSYGHLKKETDAQYDFMTSPKEKGGMGLHHEVVDHDPYPTSQAMARDVAGGRIKTFSTEATGGHAVFSNQDNDRFRAVHDVFGHAATGRGFSRHGEEAAFLSHRQMFSKKARPAMTSETKGQNSYLNYGPGEFPDQGTKLIGLPGFATRAKR